MSQMETLLSVLSLLGQPAPSPALPIELDVEVDSQTQELSFAFRHHGTEPIRFFADRGLLSLELSTEGRRRPLRCAAPLAARPRQVEPDRVVELAGGEAYEESIALRYLCWGKSFDAILSSPYRVRARYAFPGARRPIAWSVGDRAAPKVAVLVSDERLVAPVAGPQPAVSGPGPIRLDVRTPYVDSVDGRQVPVVVRVVNDAAEPARLVAHPRHFRFTVAGRQRQVDCALAPAELEPSREAFRRLAPGGAISMSLDVAQYCPEGTFARPGVYEVRPTFEPSDEGARFGVRALTGQFAGRPVLVRVDSGALVSYEPQGAQH